MREETFRKRELYLHTRVYDTLMYEYESVVTAIRFMESFPKPRSESRMNARHCLTMVVKDFWYYHALNSDAMRRMLMLN